MIPGSITRPLLVGLVVGGLLLTATGAAAAGYSEVATMLSKDRASRRAAASRLREARDLSLVPALVDAVFFTPKAERRGIFGVLSSLTGESHTDYYAWVAYVGAHGEIEPAPGYLEWKVSVLERIDRRYRDILYAGAPARIRLEEVVWGGVPVAGIPALDDPPHLPGAAARYLEEKEKVFGLVLNGEARAYPLRILSWHEMVNDVLGSEPITLSFCTLCGSGIFFHAATPNGGAHRFDTSGLLYRSNKLMVDRQSRTLWSNLTGEPVVGRLALSRIRLELLPGTLTSWREWYEKHPDTTVLDLDALRKQLRPRYTYEYRPGAADERRRGVAFPVWLESDALEREAEVYALRLESGIKAFPIEPVLAAGVVNDRVGDEPVVLIANRDSGAVRAYRRGEREFWIGGDDLLRDEAGREWRIEEVGLRLASTGEAALLERLPGHVSFWFGWYGFYPQTEVWLPAEVGKRISTDGVD